MIIMNYDMPADSQPVHLVVTVDHTLTLKKNSGRAHLKRLCALAPKTYVIQSAIVLHTICMKAFIGACYWAAQMHFQNGIAPKLMHISCHTISLLITLCYGAQPLRSVDSKIVNSNVILLRQKINSNGNDDSLVCYLYL